MDLEDYSYEDRQKSSNLMRMGLLTYLLSPSRIWVDPQLRQLLGFLLREKNWVIDPIKVMYIKPDGVMYCGMQYQEHRFVQPFGRVEFIAKQLTDLVERAELDTDDREWLLSMPGVEDLRSVM